MPNISKKQQAGYKNFYSQKSGKRARAGSSNNSMNQSRQEASTVDVGNQTDFDCPSNRLTSLQKNFNILDVANIFVILIDKIPSYSAVHKRVLSVAIYLLLRLVGIQFESVRQIGCCDIKTCHSWVLKFEEERDFIVILEEGRGRHLRSSFYDNYPELEQIVKLHVLEGVKRKNSSFDCVQLAKYVNEQFRELYPFQFEVLGLNDDELVRSVERCRVDLLNWGAVWDKNNNRPYFEGHEREENVEHSKKFCAHFLDNRDLYFYPLRDQHRLNIPFRKPIVLLAHDESTFRSGDVQCSRWFLPGSEPFHSKGRGRSIMVSDFLMQFEESLFELSEEEYQRAVQHYPELDEDDELLNYFPRSASARIHPQKDCYFNNETILKQFERLFKLSKFKTAFEGKQLQILVDNATTHSTKAYDVQQFNKKPGTYYPHSKIIWKEDEDGKR